MSLTEQRNALILQGRIKAKENNLISKHEKGTPEYKKDYNQYMKVYRLNNKQKIADIQLLSNSKIDKSIISFYNKLNYLNRKIKKENVIV
jgi:hypothetical protein